ncbi:MAG: ABC transporter ATP-binding protein [Bacteroidetes bacterium]|nr:MAG: ABC transporter ATP-binding protein [Bacteroidota bacterium]
MIDIVLETKALSIGYRSSKGDKVLGKSLNLKLRKGSFVGLLGPNGSGKSTLIRSISGLLDSLAGEVFINNISLKKLSRTQKARMISVVLTDKVSSMGLSVFDMVSYGRFPHTNWLGKLTENDIAIVEESLKLVDMEGFANRMLHTLSDGERQRVMIAKALAQKSDIVILDEPTAHLDLINRVEIMKLLQKLAHEQHQAILISTHELDLAMQSTDELWLMTKNKSITVGAPEDLILNHAMQDVFAQSAVDFDHITGMFKMKHAINEQMHFECNQAQIALWTRKALEKIGVALVEDIQNKNKIIYKSDVWHVEIGAKHGQFSNLAALVNFVKVELEKKSLSK